MADCSSRRVAKHPASDCAAVLQHPKLGEIGKVEHEIGSLPAKQQPFVSVGEGPRMKPLPIFLDRFLTSSKTEAQIRQRMLARRKLRQRYVAFQGEEIEAIAGHLRLVGITQQQLSHESCRFGLRSEC